MLFRKKLLWPLKKKISYCRKCDWTIIEISRANKESLLGNYQILTGLNINRGTDVVLLIIYDADTSAILRDKNIIYNSIVILLVTTSRTLKHIWSWSYYRLIRGVVEHPPKWVRETDHLNFLQKINLFPGWEASAGIWERN